MVGVILIYKIKKIHNLNNEENETTSSKIKKILHRKLELDKTPLLTFAHYLNLTRIYKPS